MEEYCQKIKGDKKQLCRKRDRKKLRTSENSSKKNVTKNSE